MQFVSGSIAVALAIAYHWVIATNLALIPSVVLVAIALSAGGGNRIDPYAESLLHWMCVDPKEMLKD
jgi:galactitol-specific phosphotransferase system IIC component